MDEACRWREVQNSLIYFPNVLPPISICSVVVGVRPSLRSVPRTGKNPDRLMLAGGSHSL